MPSFGLKTMLFALLLCTFSCATAKFIKVGDVTEFGNFNSFEGVRQFSAIAHILRPVVSWEDLADDGVKVVGCTAGNINFIGVVDLSDFAKGTVLTFPKKEYIRMGCPLPPMKDVLTRVDQVIFREIKISKPLGKIVTVNTEFISGAKVIPEVEVRIGEVVRSSRQLSSSNSTDLSLGPVSRDNIGTTDFSRQGTKTIFTGVKVDWQFSVSAGLCDLDFKRFPPQASWKQSIFADASGKLDFQAAIQKQKKGEIFKTGIPGAGFSKDIRWVGRVSIGLTAGIDYEASIEVGAAATARFEGGLTSGQKVTLGFTKFDVDSLPRNGRTGAASLSFKGGANANAFVDGFLGLRPFIEAGAELPLVGSADVNFGGTIGLNADIRFNSVPFRPVNTGRTIGVCRKCHSVQGTLDIEGRRLSVSGKVPGLSRREKVISNKFLDFRIGTLCLFSRTCPAVSATPSPAGTARCKCRCERVSPTDPGFCKNSLCRVRACFAGRPGPDVKITGYRCCPKA